MVTPVIVVLDEARDLGFEITGQDVQAMSGRVPSRVFDLTMIVGNGAL